VSFGQRPSDPAVHRHLVPAQPEPPSTLDEELLGAEIQAVETVETDETRVARMSSEIERSFAVLSQIECGVSMFGSARTQPGEPDWEQARELARRLGKEGFAIITGGGPGTMAAANQGAREAGALSVGLRIDLPFEEGMNPYVDLAFDFHYFFTRKIAFVRYASAFVVMPGGLGTLDETFEALTLIQTRKVRYFPVLLVGSEYWKGLVDWLHGPVLEQGKVSKGDLSLFRVTDDLDEVVRVVREAADIQGWRDGGQPND
jgi:uncharacterized protein (TIGR00730 family)